MNLEELPAPEIIEELSYKDILRQMIEMLQEIAPEFTAYIESDPLVKLMEVCAYREFLLRQRLNQAAKANLLAFAGGSDLDNLAAFYGVERREGESDEDLRARIKLRIEGWSTAGCKAAYIYHAIISDPRVKEANADSPEPGLVRISILSKEEGSVASENLLEAVNDYMQREDVRMLTDTVKVVPCGLIDFSVRAKITLTGGTPDEYLKEIKTKFQNAFDKKVGLGVSISRAWISSQLFLSGVKDVHLEEPVEDIEVSEIQCARLVGVELFL